MTKELLEKANFIDNDIESLESFLEHLLNTASVRFLKQDKANMWCEDITTPDCIVAELVLNNHKALIKSVEGKIKSLKSQFAKL